MKQETPEEKTKEQLLQEEATEYYNMAKEYRGTPASLCTRVGG
jgi:hypothetical protein